MSFTSIVKNELSKLELNKIESLTYLSAIIKNNGIIVNNVIKIYTENSSVARQIFNILKNIYNINFNVTVRRGYNYNKNYIYILETKHKVDIIVNDLSLNTLLPKDFLLDDDSLIRTYLRGVFVSTGSINDPKKSRYHLEFLINSYEYAEFIKSKINLYGLNSKIIKRDTKYMIYIKEAEKIGDFLRMISAIEALLYFEDIRIYRDHKNMTNRLNNCEQANVDKIIKTAYNQVEEIELIKKAGVFDLLDDKIKLVASYRLKYKEVSLQELSEIISIETALPITKSGLHHRFFKISQLASKIKETKGEV